VRLVGLPPVIARGTRLVVLGSFPGAASLAAGQYYAHPRNAFWPIVGSLLGVALPAMAYGSRLAVLRERGVGLWDVYASCRREGSLDQAIEAAEPNDLAGLKRRAPGLLAVAHNGGESARSRAVTAALGVAVFTLPSTSPANASWSFERKLAAWRAAFVAAGIEVAGPKQPNEALRRRAARYRARMTASPAHPAPPPVTLSEADGVRYLHLGSIWVQGAMRIAKPQHVELDYVQRMLASLLWLPLEGWRGGRAVQLGLGAGAVTRFTAQQLRMPTTVVEINREVVAANTAWFHLPPRAEVVCGDAGHWLQQAEPDAVRLLHVDLYDQDAAAPVLDSEPFYAACRRVLEADGGVMSVNLFGRHASFARSIGHIAAAFGAEQVWSLRPTREGNTVVVAGRGVVVPDRDALVRRAEAIESRFGALGLPARKWLRMVRPYTAPEEATA
jgi:hypoxanthine-DNA glycosylase